MERSYEKLYHQKRNGYVETELCYSIYDPQGENGKELLRLPMSWYNYPMEKDYRKVMALHSYSFTPTQSRMLKQILYDEIRTYENLLEGLTNEISETDRELVEGDLVMLKTMYSQVIKKL